LSKLSGSQPTVTIKPCQITEVTPHPGILRLNDNTVTAAATSRKEFGFRQPIVVNGTGVLVCGHGRNVRSSRRRELPDSLVRRNLHSRLCQ